MPGVRQAIVADLPRSRLALAQQWALAARFKRESYGMALIMPRTWKAALAPFLAGIPQRVGFAGEVRFVLINDVRFGETQAAAHGRSLRHAGVAARRRAAAGMADAEARGPASEIAAWRIRRGLTEDRPIVALAPGAVGPSKRWPAAAYAALARQLTERRLRGLDIGRPR